MKTALVPPHMRISNGHRLWDVGSIAVSTTIRRMTNAMTTAGTAAAMRHPPRHFHRPQNGAPAPTNSSPSTVSMTNDMTSMPPVDPGSLILLVQRSGRTLRFEGSTRLRFTGDFEKPEQRFTAAGDVLARLGQCVPRRRAG